MSGLGYIAQEPDTLCAFCGNIDECRPYGPNREQICVGCATATPEMEKIAQQRMAEYIFGETGEHDEPNR